MPTKNESERMDRALKMREELFDLANSFAVDGAGHIGVMLHESCNCILRAGRMLDGLPPYSDVAWKPSWEK